MWSLIFFPDRKSVVCKSSQIRTDNGSSTVKYKGARYKTFLISSSEDKINVQKMKKQLESETYVKLTNFESSISFEDPYRTDEEDSEYIPSDHSSLSSENDYNAHKNMSTNTDTQAGNTNYQAPAFDFLNKGRCGENNRDFLVMSTPLPESLRRAEEQAINPMTGDKKEKHMVPSSKTTKKNFCVYCKKSFAKLPRHLESMHKQEVAVQQFLHLPKGCAERKNIIETIRKTGNFEYNTNEMYNKGTLVVVRNPQKNKCRQPNHYVYCGKCRGLYSKLTLRRHFRKCDVTSQKGERNILVLGRKLKGDIHPKASEVLKTEVFPVLREDDIVRAIKYDELIITYANKLCLKYRAKYQHNMIRARIRLLGRFFLEIKKINPAIKDFASIYSPKNYDDVLSAVNIVAHLTDDCSKYESPAVAFNLGTFIKKIGNLLITECIKKSNKEQKDDTENFLKLLEEDYSTSVNRTVQETQSEIKRQKHIKLPKMEDIKALNKYLNENRRKMYKKLLDSFDFTIWKKLASYTLTSIQLFNRRRAGEIERITISDFNSFCTIDETTDHEIFTKLTKDSQEAAKQYVRFMIRGKLGRGVPVLLHKELFESVKLVIRHRKQAGVPDNNQYVFGLPGDGQKFLSACELLRTFSVQCGAQTPSSLRGTELRKHIATQSTLLDLQENEVSDLANFLGHAEKVHREHYRLPIATREITNMSRLLEIAQGKDCTKADNYCDGNNNDYNKENLENHNTHMCLENGQTFRKKRKHNSEGNMACPKIQKRSTSPMGNIKRVPWSTPERSKARQMFSQEITSGRLPSLTACVQAVSLNMELKNRTPVQLKTWIHNQIKKRITI